MESSFLKYGTITSSRYYIDSYRLEKCFSLALRQNPWGNLNFARLCTVSPLRMRYIGRNSPCIVMADVPVIQRLSELSTIITLFPPLRATVSLPTGTFNGTWSRFSISDYRILIYQLYHGKINIQFPLWRNVVWPLLKKFFDVFWNHSSK